MALFSSKKKTTSTNKKIRTTVVRTQNVAKELTTIAKANSVEIDSLDFNILEIQTYTRVNQDKQEVDWEETSIDDFKTLDAETALLHKDFQIRQMYEVEIFSRNIKDDPYKNFKLAVGANATKCKVYLSIKEGSSIKFNPRFNQELPLLINKRKLRAGILIDIFDEMLENVISKIYARVRIEENVKYDKTENILVAEGIEPVKTIDDDLILHYDLKYTNIDDNQKIDYASRGFIKDVSKDELLIEYIKPQEGKAGRNCRGEYIAPKKPIIKNKPKFNVDDTIKVVETQESIKYYAKDNGYIALDKNIYTIKNEMDVNEVSFKTTGSIYTDLKADVSMVVTEADVIKDAVGTGMHVEVSELNIEGNVGSNATVLAIKASIDGQTHKTATITAENLKINVHKGTANGKNIHITRLEHGIVHGENVEISQALGGTIIAKEAIVDLCASYVKITASKYIEIKKLQGSENIFTIDPLIGNEIKKSLAHNKEEIAELKARVKFLFGEIKKVTTLIKDGTEAFNDVKRRLVKYKKNGIKLPDSFVKQYKQFQKLQENLKTLKDEYKLKDELLQSLNDKTSTFQDSIFDARIINRDRWVGYNEIRFKLIDPPIELVYKPQEGSMDKIFAIVEVEENEFEIQAVKE